MTDMIDRVYWKEYPRLQRGQAVPFMPDWKTPAWITPTWARMVAEAHGANAAVNACVLRHNMAYQQPRPVVKTPDGEPQPGHPLQLLLNRPNELMGWNELAIYISTYKCIGGQTYLYKQRNNAGQVVALWPFHVGTIEVVPGAQTWIDSYLYDAGDGQKYRLDRADIVHLKWPNPDPSQPWQAVPPLRAIARDVDTDSEATRYMYALLVNDAVPRSVVEMPETSALTDAEYNRMKAAFRQRFGGDNRGDVAILEGGAKLNRLALNMNELAFDALHKVPEARIAAGFLIPAEYSGLNVGLEHSTYANVAEARQGFFEDTIMPMCVLDDAELTADLAGEFGGGVVVERDFSKVVAFQENEDAVYSRVVKVYAMGLMGRKESRRKLGLQEELDATDEYYSPRGTPARTTGTPSDGSSNQQVDAKAEHPILGYHIEQGVVSRNEARAQLGLPEEDESSDKELRRLQSLLAVVGAAVNANIPLKAALDLVGLSVDLSEQAAQPRQQPQDAPTTQEAAQ